jgi:hypothetical protein
VARDDPAVRLARLVEPGFPGVHLVAGRHEEGERVEPGHRLGALGVVAERDAPGHALVRQPHAHQHAVFDELDVGGEPEHPRVPVAAADDVADRQLDVVETAEHRAPHFTRSEL